MNLCRVPDDVDLDCVVLMGRAMISGFFASMMGFMAEAPASFGVSQERLLDFC